MSPFQSEEEENPEQKKLRKFEEVNEPPMILDEGNKFNLITSDTQESNL